MTRRRVGFVVNAKRSDSLETARRAATVLTDRGTDIVAVRDGDSLPEDFLDGIGPTLAADGFVSSVELVVSFGGDGTFLHAAHLARDGGVPVLGVNLGRFGFLAEVEVDALDTAMSAVAAGEWVTEDRATLTASAETPGAGTLEAGWALNEVSVEKTARQRLIRMDVRVGGQLFARLPADALIVATSTGSTAYALSAGGPIVSPRVEAMLVVPVAPHSLFDRTVIVAPDEPVEITLPPDQDPAVVSCDGRTPVELAGGSRIVVRGDGRPVTIARLAPFDFYTQVQRKFRLR